MCFAEIAGQRYGRSSVRQCADEDETRFPQSVFSDIWLHFAATSRGRLTITVFSPGDCINQCGRSASRIAATIRVYFGVPLHFQPLHHVEFVEIAWRALFPLSWDCL